LRHEKNGFLAN